MYFKDCLCSLILINDFPVSKATRRWWIHRGVNTLGSLSSRLWIHWWILTSLWWIYRWVDFLVYFEQTPEQVYKKTSWWQTTQESRLQCIHHRGVLPTWCFLPKKISDFKNIKRVIFIHNQFPGEEYTRELIRIPKLGHFSNIINLQSISEWQTLWRLLYAP